MKIIFLDIDGVLCTRRSHLAYGKEGGIWDAWDEVGCAAVRKACLAGCRLVISSTWRFHEEELWPKMDQHDLRRFILTEDWKTKDLRDHEQVLRGHEIKEWLDRHPEATEYKILDDDIDMLEDQKRHFIQTDGEDGMTSDNIKKLLNWSRALKS